MDFELGSLSSAKFSVTSVCREYGCGFDGSAAGHMGDVFVFFATLCKVLFVFEDGVREGSQNGNAGLDDCRYG